MKPPRFLINFLIEYADKRIQKYRGEIWVYIPHEHDIRTGNQIRDEGLLSSFTTPQIEWWKNFKTKCEGIK